jgi:hypothetical protein
MLPVNLNVSEFVMFDGKCSCYMCFICMLTVAVTWAVVLTVYPSSYVELLPFCILEWFKTFNCVILLYFRFLFEEVKL